MKRTRIVERTLPTKDRIYVIQSKRFLFFWMDCKPKNICGDVYQSAHAFIESAKASRPMFDGSKYEDKVIE